jgi:hypothetical protein
MKQDSTIREEVLGLARAWVSFGLFEDRELVKAEGMMRTVHLERASAHYQHTFQLLTSALDYDYDHAMDFIAAHKAAS